MTEAAILPLLRNNSKFSGLAICTKQIKHFLQNKNLIHSVSYPGETDVFYYIHFKSALSAILRSKQQKIYFPRKTIYIILQWNMPTPQLCIQLLPRLLLLRRYSSWPYYEKNNKNGNSSSRFLVMPQGNKR